MTASQKIRAPSQEQLQNSQDLNPETPKATATTSVKVEEKSLKFLVGVGVPSISKALCIQWDAGI